MTKAKKLIAEFVANAEDLGMTVTVEKESYGYALSANADDCAIYLIMGKRGGLKCMNGYDTFYTSFLYEKPKANWFSVGYFFGSVKRQRKMKEAA